jgi:DNA replication protein DnaC
MTETNSTVATYAELLELYEETGTPVPKWLLDKLGRRDSITDADELRRLALEAGVPERYSWAVPDGSRNELMAKGTGYYLHGVSGDGKSTMASGMLKGWLAAGMGQALWVPAVQLMPEISDTYGGKGSETAVVGRYASSPLLVIDDLGKENVGRWSLSKLFWLLDARYGAKRPTIVTSQHSPEELGAIMAMQNPETAKAIVGRLHETYRQIRMGDVDHRLEG